MWFVYSWRLWVIFMQLSSNSISALLLDFFLSYCAGEMRTPDREANVSSVPRSEHTNPVDFALIKNKAIQLGTISHFC